MNIPYLLFEAITNKFSDDRIIGSGGFGNVYKGVLYNKDLIAVKLLHPVQALDARAFKNEVGNLFRVEHPNIVGLLGYCDDIHSEYVDHNGQKVSCKHIYRVLCFEYFPGGSLDKHLNEQTPALDWSTRYNIIKGICAGLNYLHECDPPILHLDLKPSNILLDSSLVPKLADFGLSRAFCDSRTHVTQQRTGTEKYMPPEYINGGEISVKNDVFSLGVVMIDIMEGHFPFHEMGETRFKEEVLAKCSSMIEPTMKYRPQLVLQVKTCIDIAMRCVDSDRKNRPTIATILATLNEKETQIPNKQIAVPLSPKIYLKNSLAETLKLMTAKPDNIKIDVPNPEQVPDIREASSNVEGTLIIGKIEDRETSSYVEEELIIGRTEEKKKILSILSKSSKNEMVILPIYGIGGIGKTTLAQLVFNDTEFHGYSRVWVYVSEKLDLNKIGNSIISQLSKESSHIASMQMLHDHLAELFADKRILIVLDDLWEDKQRELGKLKTLLRLGKGRKVIIVTTRDEAIARKICGNLKSGTYKLDILTNDMCWAIIKQKSGFENRADKKQLEDTGRDIANKCGGVALAAQSLGYMLMSMCRSDEWESVRNSGIWNSSSSDDPSLPTHEVLASLKLSYSHMHRWLQYCFSYCAVFPKGHNIRKNDLIHQWIALQLTEPSRTFDSMQLCEQYITQLLGMSFLQYSMEPLDRIRAGQDKAVILFKMHDLVHDLARAMLADEANRISNGVRSSSQYALITDCSKPLQSSASSPENIKALHFLDCAEIELCDGAFSPAKCLVVLDLSGCLIQKIPDSIGQLKQLRYLHAPVIQDGMIPNCITELSKLNYLNVRGSYNIKALPDSIGDMNDLMYLDLSHSWRIAEFPVSFVQLKQLVHLDLSGSSASVSQSLGGFTKLQYLNLSGFYCHRTMEDTKVLSEVIGNLTKLRYLNLSNYMWAMDPSDVLNLLNSVSKLSNLEHLYLDGHKKLDSIPESMGNLTKLHTLDLSGCNIRVLPAWMHKMVSLKIVNVDRLDHTPPGLSFASLPEFLVHASPSDGQSNLIMLEPTNPEKLKISKLENVMTPEEAQSIKLMEKLRMNDLTLEWTTDCDTRSVDDKDVLEKLVPPNTINTLHVIGYRSTSFPTNWLMGIELPNIGRITLENLPKCNNLPPLGQLPRLLILSLRHLDSLEEFNTAYSSGEVMFPRLDTLHIMYCPNLRMKPCLPRALSTLQIEASNNMVRSPEESVSQTSAPSLLHCLVVGRCMGPLHNWKFLQHVSALSQLTIRECTDLSSFASPEVIQCLSSLESLVLCDSGVLDVLPTWLVQLTSIRELTIGLPKLEELNDNTRQLTRLERLTLEGCQTITSIPQWVGELTSLQSLHISGCYGVTSLPSSIRQLTELVYLYFNEYEMELDDIREMFLSIPADADEINVDEYYHK
ncbi:unnamed protein product [Alopecurus aequalis]